MSKFCTNCGSEIPEGGDICLKCGKMLNSPKNNNSNNNPNVIAIISFVLSIIAFITSFIVVGIIFGIVGLITSIIGLVSSKKNKNGKGLSIAALVISIISILISIFYIFIIGLFVSENKSEIKDEIDKEICRSYGSNYTLTNGKNVAGSNEYDEWFCCPKGQTKNIRNCREY